MVSNDLLVRRKWAEWRKFDQEWGRRSYDDFDKWLAYKDKRGPELTDTALKWKIFHHPKKDNGEEDKESISFTREFQSYWRPSMKYLFDLNEKILENVARKGEFSAFVEYGFVQIIPKYIGIDDKDFYNLPRRDPEKLKTIFELSQMVFRLFDNEFDEGKWDKIGERQEKMLQGRKEFQQDRDKGGEREMGPPIIDINSDVSDDFKVIYSCQGCGNKTYPALMIDEAEKRNASAGAIIIIKNKISGKETRRSVLCYQCMRKTEPESLCNANEKPFMSYLGPDGLYDK